MKAIILCGGKGTRMRPLTLTIPKPLLEIDGKTILEYVFENLRRNEIEEAILTVGYLKEKIIEYFKDKDMGLKVDYLEEEKEQNTAGSIIPLKEKMSEDFIVMMGDQITNINLKKLVEFHKKHAGIATIVLKKKKYPLEYGIVDIENGKVIGFKEKPILEKHVNTAIYVFSPRIFEFIKEKEDFAKNVFPRLLEKKEKIYAYVMEEEWLDIGRIKDYEELKNNPKRLRF